MKTLIRKSLIIVGATIAIAGSAPTFASASEPAVKVAYSPVELTYTLGRERLYQKLQTAARRICGDDNFGASRSLEVAQQNKSCYQETLSSTLEKIGNSELSALHES